MNAPPLDDHQACDHQACDDVPDAPRHGLALRLIDFYQRAAEGRPSPCRFTPSCSSYAREAFEVHGRWRGMWLTIRRLARCRPFGPSGFDPVPERRDVAREGARPARQADRHPTRVAHAAATQRN